MNIPLTLLDISLWLATTSIILLITSELIATSQEYSTRILIQKTRLRFAAIGCGLAFFITVVFHFI
jgi:hypothetical protein